MRCRKAVASFRRKLSWHLQAFADAMRGMTKWLKQCFGVQTDSVRRKHRELSPAVETQRSPIQQDHLEDCMLSGL